MWHSDDGVEMGTPCIDVFSNCLEILIASLLSRLLVPCDVRLTLFIVFNTVYGIYFLLQLELLMNHIVNTWHSYKVVVRQKPCTDCDQLVHLAKALVADAFAQSYFCVIQTCS